MKRLFMILGALYLVTSAQILAQNITEIEYFFNEDPGVGSANSISSFSTDTEINFSETINTSSLVNGLHTLYMRAKDSDNTWGIPVPHLLFVDQGETMLVDALEYFINEDPGVSLGTPVEVSDASEVELMQQITTENLSAGLHTLYLRAKSTDGDWGIPVPHLLFVDQGETMLVDALEYFINEDPGVGLGTPVEVSDEVEIEISQDLMTSGLPTGLHTLYIRAKSTGGDWGIPVPHLLFVDQGETMLVDALEYFINEDPGVSLGTPVEVSDASEVELMQQITTENLSAGLHTLYLRAKSTDGVWGIPINKIIFVDQSADTVSLVVSAEYFFNEDPGVGSATPLDLNDAQDLEEVVTLITEDLIGGTYQLNIRVQNEFGEWGIAVAREILVTNPPRLSNLESDTLLFTENDPSTIISDSLKVIAEGGFQIDSAIVAATEGFIYGTEDQLNFTSDLQDSVQFSSDSLGIFKFTGSASAAFYQQIFRGIEYTNVSDDPNTSIKIFSFQVFGNEDSSELVSRSIQVIPVDDPPEKYVEPGPIILPEDVIDSLAIRLNDFYRDVDSPISYSIVTDADEIDFQLVGDSLFISSDVNWYGEAELNLEVSSLGFSLIDSLDIIILPLNDAPFVSKTLDEIILEEDFGDSLITHLDSLFSDVDLPDDSLRFSINIDENSVVRAGIAEGVLTLNSKEDQNGSFSFNVIAVDDSSATDSLTISGKINPVNDPPFLIEFLPDTSVAEDADQFSLINLNNYFDDIDSELIFEIKNDPENIDLEISEVGELLVTSAPNWNGTQSIIINAKDEEYEVSDTLHIEVQSVNDAAPTQPVLLAPNRGVEATLNTYLVWSLAKDTVEFEDPRPLYEVQVDISESFEFPLINQSDIGLSTILQRTAKREFISHLQSNPSDEDSVFAVRLGALNGADQLEDDIHYFWRVRSVDNEDSASVWSNTWDFRLNIENDAPGLVSSGFTPADSITISSLNPTLSWNTAIDIDYSDTPDRLMYIVEISNDNAFISIEYSDTTEIGINSTNTESLLDESIYFWRVKTVDDEGLESDWSETQTFIINQQLDPPTAFELQSPINGVDTLTVNPIFSWTSSSDTDLFDQVYYRYRLSEDSLFNNLLVDEILASDTTLILLEPLSIGEYFWKVVAIDTDSLFTFGSNSNDDPFKFTIVEKVSSELFIELPVDYTLSQNYPNPFNPSTTLRFGLPEAANVRLEIFNLLGRKVATLLENDLKQAGWHSVQFDAGNLATGLYVYRIRAGNFVQTKQMMLIK